MKRNTEQADELRKRLDIAKSELTKMGDYDFVVINDDLNKATSDVKALIKK